MLGLYEKSMPGGLTVGQKLTEAKTAGFDYLELSIDETDEKLARLDFDGDQLHEWQQAQREAGVPILSICLSGHRRYPLGHPDPAVRAESLCIMEKAVALAAGLGVRVIQLAGYDVYYQASNQETRALFAQNLAHAVQIAARCGVTLAFETMETDFMNTVAKGMEWVHLVRSPWLQMYPDLGNLTNAALGESSGVAEDLRCGQGHIVAMHLKETTPGVFREVPYGAGYVDFAAGVAAAYQLGVRLYVGEFWYTGGEDWRETLRENSRFLRAAMQKAIGEGMDGV